VSVNIRKPQKKLLYPLREVSRMTGLSPEVIKRWEKIFPQIKPVRNRAGNRSYPARDLKIIFYIRDLIYVHKLPEDQVRERLKHYRASQDTESPVYYKSLLAELKMEVEEIRQILNEEE